MKPTIASTPRSSIDHALGSLRVASAVPRPMPAVPRDDAFVLEVTAPADSGRQYLLMPTSGAMRLAFTGQSHDLSHDLSPGQVAMVCPVADMSISVSGSGAGEISVIELESRGHIYTLLEHELPRMIVVDQTPLLQSVRELLRTEASVPEDRRSQSLVCKLTEVAVSATVSAWIATTESPPGWIGGVSHPVIGATLEAMHCNPEVSWTVTEMAERAHMSRSHFARTFREIVGTSPNAHLLRWRMAQALQLMDDDPRMSLKEVAERLGYSDEFALSRAFKRRFGSSPRQYVDRTHGV